MNGDGESSRQHNWKVLDLGPFPQKNISPPNFTIQSLSPGIASSFTIVGLEEFVLEVNTEDTITHLNDGMARLLGASARKEAITTPVHRLLSRWKTSGLGGDDRTVRIWDAASGHALLAFSGRQGRILAVAVSPHGNVVASGSDDKTISLWPVIPGLFSTDPEVLLSQAQADSGLRLEGIRVVAAGLPR